MPLSRRTFLRGVGAGGVMVRVGLPPLAAMLNESGTAYAAPSRKTAQPIDSRILLWFNGNGILENYWTPRETGANYEITPCLKPLAPFRHSSGELS